MKTKFLTGILILNLIGTGFLLYKYQNLNNSKLNNPNDVITARAIVLVDSLGVERIIIGAHLPDPTMHGYRMSRGADATVSGVMLYDSEGQERGGYVTDDHYGNIFLTLDSKVGQQALFIAEPQGGATMQVWGRNQNKVTIGAYDDEISFDVMKNGNPIKIISNE